MMRNRVEAKALTQLTGLILVMNTASMTSAMISSAS